MTALDASAVLALLLQEPGAERVERVWDEACISTVNLAEVLLWFERRREGALPIAARLVRAPVHIISFSVEQAALAAQLVVAVPPPGLSLGDRACLALARERGITAMTADRAWRDLDLGVTIEVIR